MTKIIIICIFLITGCVASEKFHNYEIESKKVTFKIKPKFLKKTEFDPICFGERSERVSILQKKLNELGFAKINTFGYFGEITEKATSNLKHHHAIIEKCYGEKINNVIKLF